MKKPVIVEVTREDKYYTGAWKGFSISIKTKSKRFFEEQFREALNIKGNHNVYFNYQED